MSDMKLSSAQRKLLRRLLTEDIVANHGCFRWPNFGEWVNILTLRSVCQKGLVEFDGKMYDPETRTGGWSTWTYVRISKAGREAVSTKNPAAVALGRRGGLKGGKARAASLSPEQRSAIAKKAAQARWARVSVGGKD